MHSPCRTQRFYIYMEDIPLFCASQFVRSTQGVQWYQRSRRTDRGGEDFREMCSLEAEHLDFAWNHGDWDAVNEVGDVLRVFPDRFDRYAPTSLMGDINAEAIINMSRKRLCAKASKETREIWEQVIAEVAKVDLDLALFCVKPCVFSGGICREHKCCGFNKTDLFQKQLNEYKKLFV